MTMRRYYIAYRMCMWSLLNHMRTISPPMHLFSVLIFPLFFPLCFLLPTLCFSSLEPFILSSLLNLCSCVIVAYHTPLSPSLSPSTPLSPSLSLLPSFSRLKYFKLLEQCMFQIVLYKSAINPDFNYIYQEV